jgi:hypothetical protein
MLFRTPSHLVRIGVVVGLLFCLFLALPFFRIGFSFIGRSISPGISGEGTTIMPWPVRSEVVATLTPTLRWPANPGSEYLLTLFEEPDKLTPPTAIFSSVSTINRLTIPDQILIADRSYRWQVESAAGIGQTIQEGCFTTASQVQDSGLLVTPAAYPINFTTLQHGLRLDISVDQNQEVEVVLPAILTAGGARRVIMNGSFELPVFPALDLVHMPTPDSATSVHEPIQILVRTTAAEIAIPVHFDGSSLGGLLRTVKTGFDPLLDTPNFSNFVDGLLASVTQGTCLGMVLLARQSFLNSTQCQNSQKRWCPRLRLQSLLEAHRLKQEMNFLHLANLDPQNWSVAVPALVTDEGQYQLAAELLGALSGANPVPVALISPRRNESQAGETGHAILVYAVHEFEDFYIFWVYDPDQISFPGDPIRNFLAISKASGAVGQVRYTGRHKLESVEAYILPEFGTLSSLSPVIAHTFSALDTTLVQSLHIR